MNKPSHDWYGLFAPLGSEGVDAHETTLDIGDFSIHARGNSLEVTRRNKIDVPSFEYGSLSVDGTTNANVTTRPGGVVTVLFDHAITAFGADFAHFNNGHQRTEILAAGETLNPSVAATIAPRFYGFVSDTPFTMVQFRGVVGGRLDAYGIDNLTHGGSILCGPTVVPEPSSLLGFAALSLVAGAARRRGRRSSSAGV